MFAITGTGFSAARRLTNDGKVRPRHPACAHRLALLAASSLMFRIIHASCSTFTLQPSRHTLDTWEENMMERDRRLTGSLRGQSVSLCTLFLSSSMRVRRKLTF